MTVEIEDGYLHISRFQDFCDCNGEVVEITEPHHAIAFGVMAGWTHQRKGGSSGECAFGGEDGGAGRKLRNFEDLREKWRIGVRKRAGPHGVEHFTSMDAQNVFLGARDRLNPCMNALTELCDGGAHSLGALGMPGVGVIKTMRGVENHHDWLRHHTKHVPMW